jgi:centrosomal protein CEP76
MRKTGGKKARAPDVAIFEGNIIFEEVFEFRLSCENWNLEMEDEHPDFKRKWKKEKKSLTFVMPKTCKSDASKAKLCTRQTLEWMPKGKITETMRRFFWPTAGAGDHHFKFIGTITALQQQFFIIRVHSGNQWPGSFIGSALLDLRSVLDISVFRGRVKMLAEGNNENLFKVAMLTGSVKCLEISKGQDHVENNIPGGRPRQLKSAVSVHHLNPKECSHLVVHVQKCFNLAVGDETSNSSDPFIKVKWDNMVMVGPIRKTTLKPVFNFNFFFPVRFFCGAKKILQRRYATTAMLWELASKGDINIQVWDDDDGTSADILGAVTVPLQEVLRSRTVAKRTLLGPPAPVKEADAMNDLKPQVRKQWYERPHSVHVFDGMDTSGGVELVGTPLDSKGGAAAKIFFEAYFFHDSFAKDLPDFLETEDMGEKEREWKSKEKDFLRINEAFSRDYAKPFPDSIGAKPPEKSFGADIIRRFPPVALNPQAQEASPLMAFLSRIITPEEYTRPSMLLHWVSCIEFKQSNSQERSGLIPNHVGAWKDSQTLMSGRKGTVQDHAILLCSVLLGSDKDAYVCKGTIWVTDDVEAERRKKKGEVYQPEKPKLVEHCWVMTREDGWVTFWEPCTMELYHLPSRYKPKEKKRRRPSKKGKQVDGDEEAEDQDAVALTGAAAAEDHQDAIVPAAAAAREEDAPWPGDAQDEVLGQPELEALPIVGLAPRPKMKAAGRKKGARDKERERMAEQRLRLRTAPLQSLLDPESTLVDWLPYSSIEVVFNTSNLWANRQNHHPACINYDLDDVDNHGEPTGWLPLLSELEKQTLAYNLISQEVLLEPQIGPDKIMKLEEVLVTEMEENMRLARRREGKDTIFDKGPHIVSVLEQYLSIQESLRRLDMDFCPFAETPLEQLQPEERYLVESIKDSKCQRSHNKFGTPFKKDNEEEQPAKWREVLNDVADFEKSKSTFNTRRGKVFKGFPVHFSTTDKELIRKYLMQNKDHDDYRKLLQAGNRGDENVIFTVHCKIYSLLGGITSTWLYFGCQYSQKEADLQDD